MKLMPLIAAAALALAACPHGAMAQSAPAPAAAGTDVERGRQLYMTNGCFSCHGTVGQGGERSGAPKLAPDTYPYEAFRVLVRTPREAMPRFDPQYLTDDQLQAIHRYLSAVPKGLAAKDIPMLQAVAR